MKRSSKTIACQQGKGDLKAARMFPGTDRTECRGETLKYFQKDLKTSNLRCCREVSFGGERNFVVIS